jgi:hypothetical protein
VKTEVPGLEKNGNGTFVQKDLSKYHEMRARRQLLAELEGTKQEVTLLRLEVQELREMLLAHLEDRS